MCATYYKRSEPTSTDTGTDTGTAAAAATTDTCGRISRRVVRGCASWCHRVKLLEQVNRALLDDHVVFALAGEVDHCVANNVGKPRVPLEQCGRRLSQNISPEYLWSSVEEGSHKT
jgi:hypothetical protein